MLQRLPALCLAPLLLSLLALPLAAEEAGSVVPQAQAEISLSFAAVVKRATPAVVNIYASRTVPGRVSPFAADPFFADMFRNLGATQPRVENSLGSGVIVSADGYVVSNYHVVGQADAIRVVLGDRREFEAKVVLGDRQADLAVLRLEGASGLPVLPLRASDDVEVGDLVLAIGNPFGVGQTVSQGIVSGLARSAGAMGEGRGYYIQTDAAINPGNSGGALVDTAGRLVGINTSILSRGGGSNGIGFAIPADLVGQFVAQAEAGNSRFRTPWAGLDGKAVDAELAEALGMALPEGLAVSRLDRASSFARAGLATSDVILAIDGAPVNSPAELDYRLSIAGIGATVQVERLRRGAREVLPVTLEAAPETPPRAPLTLAEGSPLDGLAAVTLNPAVIAEQGLPGGSTGVLVTDPGPLEGWNGLRKGDVITAINGREVRDTVTLRQAARARQRNWQVEIARNGQPLMLRFRS